MVAASRAQRPAVVLAVGLCLLWVAGCSREQRHVREHLEGLPGVASVDVSCGVGGAPSNTGVCASVVMSDGAVLQFVGLGYQSFGPVPSRVRLAAAGGRSPLMVSCQAQASVADFDRSGLFGHHFSPAIDGVADAIHRYRDVIEELEFWPQCPQFWEFGEEQGPLYRYCAHRTGAVGDPPPRPCS